MDAIATLLCSQTSVTANKPTEACRADLGAAGEPFLASYSSETILFSIWSAFLCLELNFTQPQKVSGDAIYSLRNRVSCNIWGTRRFLVEPEGGNCFATQTDRDVAERFLHFLIRDGLPITLVDGRTVEQRAEDFCVPRSGNPEKTVLGYSPEKEKGRIGEENQQLEGLERSSVYSNKNASVMPPKPVRKKAPGNLEEKKRLFVADRIFRLLDIEKNRYEDLHKRYEPSSESRGLEMKLRRFEQDYISAGKLTCEGIVTQQFDRFKSNQVMQLVAENRAEYQRLVSGSMFERWEYRQEIRHRLRRTEIETKVLSKLCSEIIFSR